MKVIQSFTLTSRLALSSKQVSCLRFPSVGRKVWTTTLSSFFDFRKFIWVNMINSKSLRCYNVKIKKKIYLVFQKVLIVKASKFYTGKILEFECLNFRQHFSHHTGKKTPNLHFYKFHLTASELWVCWQEVEQWLWTCICHLPTASPTEHVEIVFTMIASDMTSSKEWP